MPAAARDRIVADLRSHLARMAPVRVLPGRLPMGIEALEARVGGWPRPGISTIAGPIGSGRLGLLLPAMADLTRRGRVVAAVDPAGWLYPPGLPGVVVERLLIVRPGGSQVGWAAEQLARCGDIDLVVIVDPPRLGRSGRRLLHAAETGGTAVVAVVESPDPDVPVALRLEMAREGVRVVRGGRGPEGAMVATVRRTA